MSTIKECRAKNPETCRYHGTLGVLAENNLKAQQAEALRRQDFDLYTNATGLLDELYEKRKKEDSVAGFEEFIDDDGDNESLRRLKEQLSDPSLELLRKQLTGSSYTLRLHKTGIDGVIPISTLEEKGAAGNFGSLQQSVIWQQKRGHTQFAVCPLFVRAFLFVYDLVRAPRNPVRLSERREMCHYPVFPCNGF